MDVPLELREHKNICLLKPNKKSQAVAIFSAISSYSNSQGFVLAMQIDEFEEEIHGCNISSICNWEIMIFS